MRLKLQNNGRSMNGLLNNKLMYEIYFIILCKTKKLIQIWGADKFWKLMLWERLSQMIDFLAFYAMTTLEIKWTADNVMEMDGY